jgi:hypothetical protein
LYQAKKKKNLSAIDLLGFLEANLNIKAHA